MKIVIYYFVLCVSWLVRLMPLETLGPLFLVLAARVSAHRKGNDGLVPFSIFPQCLRIGGVYPCVDVVVEVVSETGQSIGYALKKRSGNGEQAWEGKFQIVGVVGRASDSPETIFGRLKQELFDGDAVDTFSSRLEFVGLCICNERERFTTCWGLVYRLALPISGFPLLSGKWEVFASADVSSIIDHHQKILAWVKTPNRQLFADLR